MDELREFCARILDDPEAAARVARSVGEASPGDRLQQLGAAVSACREADASDASDASAVAPGCHADDGSEPGRPQGLAGAVARELAAATGRLPQRQREALALRELLRLSHRELAAAIGVTPVAVAPLLARARLGLRDELRGAGPPPEDCDERDRALRTITLRQDSEAVLGADNEWVVEHLGHCESCGRAHAAMLEASVCYRAWRVPAGPAPPP